MKNLLGTTSSLALAEKDRQLRRRLLDRQKSFLPERCLYVRRLRVREQQQIEGCHPDEEVWGGFNPETSELTVLTRDPEVLRKWLGQSEVVMLWVC